MIFLSYAREDANIALNIYDRLKNSGFDPWIDQKHLKPGQEWEPLIWAAAAKAKLFCILLSNKSVNKSGFIRKEMRYALDKWKEKLADDTYLIPCLIEEIDPPNEFRQIQYQKLISADDFDDFIKYLRETLEPGEDAIRGGPDYVPLHKNIKIGHSSPYWDISIEYPNFLDVKLHRLNVIIRRYALESSAEPDEEGNPPEEDMKSFFSAGYQVYAASSRLVSVYFGVDYYHSGAAHPNHGFRSFNYDIEAEKLFNLEDMFEDKLRALKTISRVCRLELMKQRLLDLYEEDLEEEKDEFIETGAGPDWDNFTTFSVDATSINLLFAPYSVGAYAWGSRFVRIAIDDISELFNENFTSLIRRGGN